MRPSQRGKIYDYLVGYYREHGYPPSMADIAAAMIDGEATVKRFFKEKGHYRLQPENPTMAPIIVDHVDILGRVVSACGITKARKWTALFYTATATASTQALNVYIAQRFGKSLWRWVASRNTGTGLS